MQAVVEPTLITPPKVRLKPIALPSEHGGWGMLGAPILAGLLIAPSWAGLGIGIAAAAAFLTRQPFRLAVTDIRKGKRYPRTAWAVRFAGVYAATGLAALVFATFQARASFWIPLGLAGCFGAFQFAYDIRGKGHSFVPEVCGASAMALIATAITQSSALSSRGSWLVALLLALQAGTAITYAAARVRLARGSVVDRRPVWIGHVAALTLVAALAFTGWFGWAVVPCFLVLAVRSWWGLSPNRREVKAAIVGMQEVGYMLLTVACIVVAMR